jgi:hypothetical protein
LRRSIRAVWYLLAYSSSELIGTSSPMVKVFYSGPERGARGGALALRVSWLVEMF